MLTFIHSLVKARHVSELDQDVIAFPTLGHLLACRHQQERGEKMNPDLTKAMEAFSFRVLEGKDCNMQETAILPTILSLLLNSQKSD